MLWENSRDSRQIEEWIALVNLCELRGVYIWVNIHQRLYDPANYRDRKDLLEDRLESEAESAKTSHRTKRTSTASAALGRPHGPAPFGYRRQYDPRTRELVVQEEVPAEAELVRELYVRLLAGHSFKAIARDWETRGAREGVDTGAFADAGVVPVVCRVARAHRWSRGRQASGVQGQPAV